MKVICTLCAFYMFSRCHCFHGLIEMLTFPVSIFGPVSLDIFDLPLLCSTPEKAALNGVLTVVMCEVLDLLG